MYKISFGKIFLTTAMLLLSLMQVNAVSYTQHTTLSQHKALLKGTEAMVSALNKQILAEMIDVKGQVVDENGDPLHGAVLRIKNIKTVYTTDAKGYFLIKNVDANAVIHINYVGYRSIERSAKSIVEHPLIRLSADVNSLNETGITIKKSVGTQVDIKHRQHLNLGQILEGSVPGLTLKKDVASSTDVYEITRGQQGNTIREIYLSFKKTNPSYVANFPTYESYLARVTADQFKGIGTAYTTKKSNKDNGVIAELRGASGFAGGTSGMLVVIDGFPQDNFPVNYPMANVASVEIIKDPAECIKWGPKASGGIVLITTNGGQAGGLQINYSANLYFSPRPDISASRLELASTRDILDYYKEAYDKKLSYLSLEKPELVPLSPAQRFLYGLRSGKLSQGQFQSKWDSLANLSNRVQLQQLQQNSFNQNQNLSLSGGTKAYRFTVNGSYGTTKSNRLGDNTRNLGLNSQNDLLLLKGKLKAKIYIDITDTKMLTTLTDDGSHMDPYQLLVDDGNYIYDYANTLSEEKNLEGTGLGYYNYGVNLLENARLNRNITKAFSVDSRLNVTWDLTSDLQWINAFQYTQRRNTMNRLQRFESSETRQMLNKYGIPNYGVNEQSSTITGIDFYLPSGDILLKSASRAKVLNLRSGFIFNHVYNKKHQVGATLGISASSSTDKRLPDTTLYGYHSKIDRGLPILLSSNTGGFLMNYLGQYVTPSELLVAGLNSASETRNLSLNGDVSYKYDNRYSINAKYTAIALPNYGNEPPYSMTSNSAITAAWQINKEHFFNLPWVSNLNISVAASEMQVAKLPPQITASRSLQPLWNNAAIIVSNYNLAQQNGQKVKSIEGLVRLGLKEDRFQLNFGYNLPSIGPNQINAFAGYEISKEPFFKVPAISTLKFEFSMQDISAYQGLGIMMGTTAPNTNGQFSMATNSDYGLLPPDTKNKEVRMLLGMFKDRITLDMRYYNQTVSGLSSGTGAPTDPSTGLSTQILNSKILNKGLEVALRGQVVQHEDFNWTVILNAAYNVNKALDVPKINYAETDYYMTTKRNGYSTDNIWSFRWAGLDTAGNPTVYNSFNEKVTKPDSLAIVYSGRTRPPLSGAVIQEWRYKAFFASARLMFNLGAVMKRYTPASSNSLETSMLIADRWRKPGDEMHTDIAALAAFDVTRQFLIQNSTNGILSADNWRLKEVQFGVEVPQKMLSGSFIQNLTLSVQVLNLALWTRNKYGIDPAVVSNTGLVGVREPVQYTFSLNMTF